MKYMYGPFERDRYRSKKPTKEKENFYNFMESHKKTGKVGNKIFGEYLKEKKFYPDEKTAFINKGDEKGRHAGGIYFNIKNRRGTTVAEALAKKKHIVHWHIK